MTADMTNDENLAPEELDQDITEATPEVELEEEEALV